MPRVSSVAEPRGGEGTTFELEQGGPGSCSSVERRAGDAAVRQRSTPADDRATPVFTSTAVGFPA
jgi:hypothetical protein